MSELTDWLSDRIPFSRKNAAEAVFEDLRSAILSGRLPVGTRLPSESKLAEHYAVSRPIIREAMRSLQTLGLTRSRSGSGSFVISDRQGPQLDYGDMPARDLIEARPHIEIPTAGWAALRRSDAQANRMLALCDQMERQENPQRWVQLDSDFHCLIAEAANNTLFHQFVTGSRGAMMRQSQLVNLLADRRPKSDIEHRRIALAIVEGRAEDARAAMQLHLAEVDRATSRIISDQSAANKD
ncbi:FadR/GntR family transcriptional regulator [Paracoccus sp. SMMA_5]|uniref:FadR/GntR family transcriptional regulator n=1 Tax=Paracoccus sp. SMMA_5 TaxID=2654281 RepID=UPI0012B3A0F3|nr:FadR/GntR family transcriptional regulator [Paracoccus sp. SMMA_5]UXU76479.1 FadR family transcriptional regulator [Paracoccus sp. SMMA_5]